MYNYNYGTKAFCSNRASLCSHHSIVLETSRNVESAEQPNGLIRAVFVLHSDYSSDFRVSCCCDCDGFIQVSNRQEMFSFFSDFSRA